MATLAAVCMTLSATICMRLPDCVSCYLYSFKVTYMDQRQYQGECNRQRHEPAFKGLVPVFQANLHVSPEQQQEWLAARRRLLEQLADIRRRREKVALSLGLLLLQKRKVSVCCMARFAAKIHDSIGADFRAPAGGNLSVNVNLESEPNQGPHRDLAKGLCRPIEFGGSPAHTFQAI